ncbi:class I SAM-dependent methyltransferase [bacterium]|nr:class I SAM-dependent methyltransferase [bacterium]MBU1936304.1 class I SAM-dependent methyltransferase [bacterium]
MSDYYRDKLSAERLKRCYEIASPRIRQYIEAEVDFVLSKIHAGDMVLELGCGYGRILPRLAQKAGRVIGIDNSPVSLTMARQMSADSSYHLAAMNAAQLAFRDNSFDVVVCIQNGISAFHVDQKSLIDESIRVTKSGGILLFSSYSEKFWGERLAWFKQQSNEGLLGEIDFEKTRDGEIVCKDGFTATTVRPEQFLSLMQDFPVEFRIEEVDESSLFCVMISRK